MKASKLKKHKSVSFMLLVIKHL